MESISYKYYRQDVDTYKKAFLGKVKMLYDELKNLEEKGFTKSVKMEARIKSYKSFCENIERGKTIEDCFGIRIVADEIALERIASSILQRAYVRSTKNHREITDTKYNAVHINLVPKDASTNNPQLKPELLLPMIEVQLCTPEEEEKNNKGRLAHDVYKIKNHNELSNTELLRAVIEEYTRVKSMKGEELDKELPEYYEIDDEGKIKQLNTKERIRKMFPTVEEFREKGKQGKLKDKSGCCIPKWKLVQHDPEDR